MNKQVYDLDACYRIGIGLALLAVVIWMCVLLAGCSTAPTARPVTRVKVRPAPEPPPMPPGFKGKVVKQQAQARSMRAGTSFLPAGGYTPGSPPMEILNWFDPETLLVRVLQQSNTVVRIKQTETLGGELQEIAVFECSQQPEAQWVATTVGRNHPQLFVAGSNEQCLAPFLAARTTAPVGTGRKVKSKDGREWYVLKLPKTGIAERYLLKPVPPPK